MMALSLVFTACKSDKQGGEGEADASDTTDMAQFADDEEFRDAHAVPTAKDFAGIGEMIEYDTPDGETGSAYAIMPEEPTDDYLLVIHEWWGLNNHIKAEAERWFKELDSVAVLALDIYDGKVADTQEKAQEYMQAVEEGRARAIIQGAINKAGEEARIATIGWCFGGGWSLKASIMAGDQGVACVMYYGMPVKTQDALEPLEAPVLAIFARQDEWITPAVAEEFVELAKATNTQLNVNFYDATHAFANPSNPDFDEQAAKAANKAANAFLKEQI